MARFVNIWYADQGRSVVLGDVGADAAMTELHPFLDLFAKWIDQLIATLWGVNGESTRVASAHITSDGVVVTANQCRGISKTVRQTVRARARVARRSTTLVSLVEWADKLLSE
jgi:hypothetical protein